jgi:hypothetical protein
MFHGPPERLHPFCVTCKRCRQTIAAPVQTMPDTWFIAACPLCGERRRYLPAELFNGRLSSGYQEWARKNPRKQHQNPMTLPIVIKILVRLFVIKNVIMQRQTTLAAVVMAANLLILLLKIGSAIGDRTRTLRLERAAC